METIDPNLISVQWGVSGVFGVVVGLLITPTDRLLQDFLASGESLDRKRAARWAASLKMTALLVLLTSIGLSLVGAREVDWSLANGFAISVSVLLTPVIAQAGFLVLVLCLVKPVPPLLTLALLPPDLTRSPDGPAEKSVIRFVNRTSGEVRVWWLNFEGNKDDNVSFTLAPGIPLSQATYKGHRFMIAVAGVDRYTVEAGATPGTAIIAR